MKKNFFCAFVQSLQAKCMQFKEKQKKKAKNIQHLQSTLNQSKATMKAQHSKLIVDYAKQVDKMYYYAYQCCKKKHNIVEDFNIDEDFITNDEAANLEDPAQDGSQTGEGVIVTGASGENTLTTNLAPMISPYWQRTLVVYVT